jgi:hypothetical protein
MIRLASSAIEVKSHHIVVTVAVLLQLVLTLHPVAVVATPKNMSHSMHVRVSRVILGWLAGTDSVLCPAPQLLLAGLILRASAALCQNVLGLSHSACLPADCGPEVILAAVDLAMPLMSAAHGMTNDGTAWTAASIGFIAQLESITKVLFRELMAYMTHNPALKPGMVAALLRKERLLLWLRCLEKLRAGVVALEAVSLLLVGVTTGSCVIADSVVPGQVDVLASLASEVRGCTRGVPASLGARLDCSATTSTPCCDQCFVAG